MLVMLTELVEAMMAQARADYPLETCGVIAGPEGSDSPLRLIPMRNAAKSADFFQFDAQEQLRVWKEMEDRGEEPVVIYHSHSGSRAYPSPDDALFAWEPNAHYVIIGIDPTGKPEARSFRIIDGDVTEEKLRLVARYDAYLNACLNAPEERTAACQSL